MITIHPVPQPVHIIAAPRRARRDPHSPALHAAPARAVPVDISEHSAAATCRVIFIVAFGAEMSRAERFAFAADVERLNEGLMRKCLHMPVRARRCSR